VFSIALEHAEEMMSGMSMSTLLLGVLLAGLVLGFASSGPPLSEPVRPFDVLNSIIGWTYTVAWSVSFYPQVSLNWKRKSVVGLSFDFVGLNLMGWICYSGFNCALYFFGDKLVDSPDKTPRVVELNDVAFALHALLLTSITVVQCFIYERGKQRLSNLSRFFIWFLAIAVVSYGFGIVTVACQHCHQLMNWLSFVYFLSYVKMLITLVKYTPQLWFNFTRKSTVGWNIHNVVLDLTGGVLSMGQVIMTCYLMQDWSAILGNPVKFGLGGISVVFDILFMVQHYVLYTDARKAEEQAAILAEAGNAVSICTILHHLVHHPELLPNSVCEDMCYKYAEHGIDVDVGAVLAYFEQHPAALNQQWVAEILAASNDVRRSSSNGAVAGRRKAGPADHGDELATPLVEAGDPDESSLH
jgi:LCT (Lysosomal Cystine Transporter) family transporter